MSPVRRRRKAAGLRVAVSDALGRRMARGPAAGLRAWLPKAAPASARGDVAIALVPDRMMRRLNRVHRGIDRVTDVLSFPAQPATGPTGATGPARSTGAEPAAPETPRKYLGDIAIAVGVAARQARDAGHSLGAELRILALHGLLHLLGYDHETDRGEMARVEERLRRRAGLPPGLIVRATRPARSRHA